MSSHSGTRTVIAVALACLMVLVMTGCTSNGSSEAPQVGSGETPEDDEAAVFEPPQVTTTIAQDDRPTNLSDEVSMFPQSFVENKSAVIDFEASYDQGDDVIERVSVKLGEAVEFEGWMVHIEAIGSDSVLWWATGPDGEQIGGEPLS